MDGKSSAARNSAIPASRAARMGLTLPMANLLPMQSNEPFRKFLTLRELNSKYTLSKFVSHRCRRQTLPVYPLSTSSWNV